ncbi:vinorine synthase [Phtheirospermum japonicum]|uniref:Vinorine synthase n=1 Tax=Phtheirospermum japonicum TaxID=374723 RepID=A0A830CGJ5_9LAMI|nr:vinorine synthase [Phtheirospermum japonicum]
MALTSVEVISQEMIKPSSPTPQHLQKLKRSYLDQLVGPFYPFIIFFYQADDDVVNNNHVQKSQRLKQSLSHTLTSFYPLAGRIQDNLTIDCNDAGVEFIDARAVDHAQLKAAIQEQPNNIDQDHLKQYLPVDPTTTAGAQTAKPLFLVQITYLDCGGIVVGVRFSHRIADCASIMDFVNVWAHANVTNDTIIPIPARLISFDLANYFPGRDLTSPGLYKLSNEKFRTKRFVFDKVKLEALRHLADSNVKEPTRVELVSAFIWKSFMQSSANVDGDDNNNNSKIFAASHAVNLRARKKSLENVFGNCLMLAIALDPSSGVGEFHEVVSELRSAIRRVDEDYITKSMQQSGDGGLLDDLNEFGCMCMKGQVEMFKFTSWCRFPVYETDFGWGKPIWLCPTEMPKNGAVLVNSRCGERIEAWVNMNDDALSILEAKFKLI